MIVYSFRVLLAGGVVVAVVVFATMLPACLPAPLPCRAHSRTHHFSAPNNLDTLAISEQSQCTVRGTHYSPFVLRCALSVSLSLSPWPSFFVCGFNTHMIDCDIRKMGAFHHTLHEYNCVHGGKRGWGWTRFSWSPENCRTKLSSALDLCEHLVIHCTQTLCHSAHKSQSIAAATIIAFVYDSNGRDDPN